MSDPTQIEVPCAVCGEPVLLPRPNTGDEMIDRVVMRSTQRIAHDECARNARAGRQTLDAAQRLEQRASRWGSLCPAFYQSSDVWIGTPDAAAKVNLTAHVRAMEWQFGPAGLVLYGQRTGSGKTTSAWLLLKREFMAGRMIVALSHGEFTRMATQLARETNKDTIRWEKTVVNCDLLFIDDLGKSRFQTGTGDGKAAEEFLFELVNQRIADQRPCIFTSNSNGADLAGKMSAERSEPFLRRLREFCTAINFDR